MTRTANENMILTKKNVENKTHSDWTTSVTSTQEGVDKWKEVSYSIYQQWLIDNPLVDSNTDFDDFEEISEL